MFDLQLKLGQTRGILVILIEKGTSVALVLEWVTPRHYRCPHSVIDLKSLQMSSGALIDLKYQRGPNIHQMTMTERDLRLTWTLRHSSMNVQIVCKTP